MGIVRGATQRLVKLELSGNPNDPLIDYLDSILAELQGGTARYGLPVPDDPDYLSDLSKLEVTWGEIKTEIGNYRQGTGDGDRLLALSETYFEQANNTVFSADAYAARQMHFLLAICLVMVGIMSLTWIFIFWANSKNLLKLELQNEKLSDLTRRDALTGVYRIDYFKEEAQRLLNTVPEKFAIVYTDFSDFKYVNDVFGYHYGDELLSRYGQIILRGLREHEICGRVSADNFVLLLRYEDRKEIADRQLAADREVLTFMNSAHHGQLLPTCCGICCVEDVIEPLNIDGFLDRANFARKPSRPGRIPITRIMTRASAVICGLRRTSRAGCQPPLKTGNLPSTTNPKWTFAPAGSAVRRPWSAGVPRAAPSSRRTASSPCSSGNS